MKALRKTISLWSLALGGLLSILSPQAFATRTCENVFNDKVAEFQYRRTDVAPKVTVDYRYVYTESREPFVADVIGKTDDLLLGIAPFGHAYLVSGSVRLDGNVLGFKTTVNEHMAELETGIVIRIKKADISKAALVKFDNTRGISCGKTTCEAMAKAGDLYIAGEHSTFYSPHEMIMAIFKNGIRDGAGNKVPFDVYYVGKFDLPNTMRRVHESSERIKKEMSVKYGMIGTGVTVTTATLLYILGVFDDDSVKKPTPNQ